MQMASMIDSSLIFHPSESSSYLDELQVPMPSDTPDLFLKFAITTKIGLFTRWKVILTLSIGPLTIV